MAVKDRLVEDLLEVGAPEKIIEYARNGFYSDYESPIAFPLTRLVSDCLANRLEGIATKAKNGEYDGTKEEADEWLRGNASRYLGGKG